MKTKTTKLTIKQLNRLTDATGEFDTFACEEVACDAVGFGIQEFSRTVKRFKGLPVSKKVRDRLAKALVKYQRAAELLDEAHEQLELVADELNGTIADAEQAIDGGVSMVR